MNSNTLNKPMLSHHTPRGQFGFLTVLFYNLFVQPILAEIAVEYRVLRTIPGQKGFAKQVLASPFNTIDIGTGFFAGHFKKCKVTGKVPVTSFVKVSEKNIALIGKLVEGGFKVIESKSGWVDLTIPRTKYRSVLAAARVDGMKIRPFTYGATCIQIEQNFPTK